MTLFLNNEEPRVKSFEDLTKNVIYYSVEKNKYSFVKNDFYDVTLPCPKCNDKIKFEYYNIDNIGNFKCLGCSFKSEEKPNYVINNINYEESTFECDGNKYSVPYKEPYFIYNYALCIAICGKFDIPYESIEKAFKTFKNIGGRLETIKYKTKEIKYIRIKQENPETLQSAFDYISRDEKPKILMLGLEQLEDFQPYYTNTFYAFDCNVDKLVKSNIERYICFSEAVAYDTANRLIYGDIEKDKISIIPSDSDDDILKELDKYDCDNVYLITWLHKYEELMKDVAKFK
jgi:Zn ribbon nucleic-acid-binding protein